MNSPPLLMTSFVRSTIFMKPSSSMVARSPVGKKKLSLFEMLFFELLLLPLPPPPPPPTTTAGRGALA